MNPQEVLAKAQSRGHFVMRLRPQHFVAELLAYRDLGAFLRSSVVRLRGWDVPHIDDRTEVVRGQDYIEQGVDWERYVEFWRLYQSGQFVFVSGMHEAWEERAAFAQRQPLLERPMLGIVGSVVYFYTELFELTARMVAQWPEAAGPACLSIASKGLMGRRLFTEPTRHLGGTYEAQVDAYEWTRTLSRADILQASSEFALDAMTELLLRFGFDAQRPALLDIQEPFLKGRYAG